MLGAFLAAPLMALDPVNQTFFGVAIKGYDPVAYFTDSKPVKGNKQFKHEWQGATWHFSNQANLDKFKQSPDQYAPQYGGYCAWAVSQNSTAGIDPDAWKIVDGKLYLNYSKKIQKQWEEDIPGFIKAADKNWPGLLSK
ncbi:YHS domain-containing (seleno)protein [Sulfidibacter corallicola]